MAKIQIKYNDSNYVLEYNRYALIAMEKRGFNPQLVESRPISSLTELAKGAFIMHHPTMQDKDIEPIIDAIPDKTEFVKALAELYKDAVESIVADKKENTGNVSWGRM